MNQTPVETYACPFKRAILHGGFGCEKSVRRVAAVQSSIACCSKDAQARCKALFELMLGSARFALRIDGPADAVPNGTLIRLQAGGLLGMRHLLGDAADGSPDRGADVVEDIHGLVARACGRFNSLNDLPFDRVVRGMTAYRLKRRRPRPADPRP